MRWPSPLPRPPSAARDSSCAPDDQRHALTVPRLDQPPSGERCVPTWLAQPPQGLTVPSVGPTPFGRKMCANMASPTAARSYRSECWTNPLREKDVFNTTNVMAEDGE